LLLYMYVFVLSLPVLNIMLVERMSIIDLWYKMYFKTEGAYVHMFQKTTPSHFDYSCCPLERYTCTPLIQDQATRELRPKRRKLEAQDGRRKQKEKEKKYCIQQMGMNLTGTFRIVTMDSAGILLAVGILRLVVLDRRTTSWRGTCDRRPARSFRD
jgi:hypothetical protein